MSVQAAIYAATTALLLAMPLPARADDLDPASLADLFVAACSVSGATAMLEESEPAPGVNRTFVFRSGPPPGTWHGAVSFRDQSFDLVAREGDFCAMRFGPVPPADLQAVLSQRLGEPAADGSWHVDRADGAASVRYRPFVEGQSGPAWIGAPGGYMYGVDAAERADTLVFYPP